MKARLVVLAASLSVSCWGGMSSADPVVKCVANTAERTCDCRQYDVTLGLDMMSVASCDAPPAGQTWECCHDIDSSGYTTRCTCGGWSCTLRATSCDCSFFQGPLQPGETRAQSCTGGVCVKRSDSCACDDDSNTSIGGDETVPSCTKPASWCYGGLRSKSTCDGLTWKPPPPPSSGECIRNGNACGPSRQAVAACCSGYCGENGTCEWH